MIAMEQDHGQGEKTAGLDKIDQEKELAPTSRDDVTESHEACEVQVGVAPKHCDTLPKEKLDDLLPVAIDKTSEEVREVLWLQVLLDNLQTTELATYLEINWRLAVV